jgi:FixJ family two-component response regulator
MNGRPLVTVVDDDESVRESLPELLKVLGYATQSFSSGEALLRSGVAEKSDCLILDVAMPGMSGPDLRTELRRRQIQVPVVFITAYRDFASLPMFGHGDAECLIKPFSEEALIKALNTAMS